VFILKNLWRILGEDVGLGKGSPGDTPGVFAKSAEAIERKEVSLRFFAEERKREQKSGAKVTRVKGSSRRAEGTRRRGRREE
jgi:hypothetical protein